MSDPKINLCMSCFFFKHTSKNDYTCFHWNANDPDEGGFCYDYVDLEGEKEEKND